MIADELPFKFGDGGEDSEDQPAYESRIVLEAYPSNEVSDSPRLLTIFPWLRSGVGLRVVVGS